MFFSHLSPESNVLIDQSKWDSLLEAARDGDRDAIGQLLQAYWNPLWKQAVAKIDGSLQGKQAASDLVQETFFDEQSCFKDFRGSTPAEMQAWLNSILTNNMRDVWRHYCVAQKRQTSLERPLHTLDVCIENRGTDSGTPSAHFQKQDKIELVHRVLQSMPQHYATVIQLRHWEALTFETIAVRMDKSPDAVRQLWYRAIERFTKEMVSHENR